MKNDPLVWSEKKTQKVLNDISKYIERCKDIETFGAGIYVV